MLNLRGEEVLLTLHIRIVPENVEEATDALNETMNTLAREDVVNDDDDAAWEWVDPARYKIVRMYQDSQRSTEVQAEGLTLGQAQAHCRRDDTHGEGWFDGYERMT